MAEGWYVYVVAADLRGPVKIGVAKNPAKRVKGLQNGNPEPLHVCYAVFTPRKDLAYILEGSVKLKFSHYRLMGEWFETDVPVTIEAVDRAAFSKAGALTDYAVALPEDPKLAPHIHMSSHHLALYQQRWWKHLSWPAPSLPEPRDEFDWYAAPSWRQARVNDAELQPWGVGKTKGVGPWARQA